jgi:phospholipase C
MVGSPWCPPTIQARIAGASLDAERRLPLVAPPWPRTRPATARDIPDRRRQPLPHQPNGNVIVDHATGLVTAALTNTGTGAVPFAVYAVDPTNAPAFAATSVLVGPGSWDRYVWDANRSGGAYDLSIHGPDGFIRSYRGAIVPRARSGAAVPVVTVRTGAHGLRLALGNAGRHPASFTLADTDGVRRIETRRVDGHRSVHIDWPATADRYDVTVTTDAPRPLVYRFAGRIDPT